MIEQRQSRRLVRHQPAAIEQKDDPLALTGLKILDSELLPAGRSPPVDVLIIVVERVISQTLEVILQTDSPRPPHAHQAQPVRAGQNGIFRELLHVGINVQLRSLWINQ